MNSENTIRGDQVPPTNLLIEVKEEEKYVPQIYPGRIVFLKAQKSSLEWSGLATEGLEIHEVPGGHVDLLRDPHAQVVGEKLRCCLERAHATLSEKTVNQMTQDSRP
jgi:thioesterase domain-containing protein